MSDRHIAPADVHATLAKHILADGYDIVLDLAKSRGRRMHDARSGRDYLDMFSCFATFPVGMNHPRMREGDYLEKLMRAAIVNPTNSDIFTTEYAEFVDTFARVGIPAELPRAFFVAGGALAVENALKAAMDWKVRRNLRAGKGEKGTQVIHFKEAFHGRSGYTVSMTNTADPRKYQYFARFDWPRVSSPKLRFPVDAAELARVQEAEAATLAEIRAAFARHPDDICAVVLEPIQAEGGDNHFRPEFLQELVRVTHTHDALFVADEVQTGVGITGTFWGYQQYGITPDLIAFGKKMQVCGILAGGRIEEEKENVFQVKSRINSTWGGNLVDMVRCQRYLEIIEEERLLDNARTTGAHLLAGLQAMAAAQPEVFSNARGRGLMCAIDFPDTELRNRVAAKAYALGMIILPCGHQSLRFRPPIDVTVAEVDEALAIVGQATAAALAKTA
jgi:L-lysine 6-transaminase